MAKNRFLAAAGVAAALAVGGAGAFIIGLPGVSGAQTTTDAPTTTVPGTTDNGSATTPRARGENCPDKAAGGTGSGTGAIAPGASGSSTNISARGRGNFLNL